MSRSASPADRSDLHWLALRLFHGLGAAELPVVRARGLSLWGYEVLVWLTDRPAVSQIELARRLGLDKSKLVRVIDELEAAGFVVRSRDRADRRRHCLTVTEAGRRVRSAVGAELLRIEAALFERLPPGEREAARRGLMRLVEALDAPAARR